MDTVELFIDETDNEDGVFAISLVNEPAIESNFITLSKQDVNFKSVNEDKRIAIGLALIPNKKILRNGKDGKFNIMFSEDTVKQASHLYLKRLNSNNTTVDHKKRVDGISVVESWIVEDPKKDKTSTFNLKAEKGSWAVMMKVDNDEVWNEIKNGTYLGFSIEGKFSEKKENLSFQDVKDIADKDVSELTVEEADMLVHVLKEFL